MNLAPIVNVLSPGAEIVHNYPAPLPDDMMAVLQKGVGAGAADLHIVEQSNYMMRVANRGTTFAPYMILFMTEKQLRAMLAAKELVGQVLDYARTRKRKK
jgi:hypothetical protein